MLRYINFKNSSIIRKGYTKEMNVSLMSVFKFDEDTAKFCGRISPEI